tara:strand:- start:232 stop:2748 length:2517 start_codon:yes stop_codon:yes gene_type:complete
MELTIAQALQQGVAAHKEGKLQDAERLYRAILQSQPLHPDANHNLGILAVSVNKASEALPLFKTALEANPNVEQFWLSYINTLIKTEELDVAKKAIADAKQAGITTNKLSTFTAELQSKLSSGGDIAEQIFGNQLWGHQADLSPAIELREVGKYEEAQAFLRRVIEHDSKDSEALSLLSQVLLLDKKETEAERVLIEAASMTPELPSVYRNQARLLLIQSKTIEALEKAELACKQLPEDSECLLVLAACLGANQRDFEALPLIEKILESNSSYAEAYANRVLIKLRKKDTDGAIEDAKMTLSLKPHLTQMWQILSSLHYQANNLSDAIEALRSAHKNEPENPDFLVQLGEYLRQDDKTSEAINVLEQATELAPEDASAWTNLGVAFQQGGEEARAKIAYEKALALNPKSAAISCNLGAMAKEAEEWESALRYLRKALEIDPNLPEAHNNLGITLQELGRLEEAESSYNQAIALKPDNAEIHNNLGSTLQELGRLDEAEASCSRAIALKPDFAEAHSTLSLTLLQNGRLKEGLAEYEWRWRMAKNLSENRHFPQPLWDGQESLKGKRVLLWSEQGIGDTINWASCLPLVASLAERTILECQEKIVPLLARSFPNIEIKPEDRSIDSKRDDFDFHLPMGSLYRHFIPHIGKNSNIDSYLIPNPIRVKFWRDRLSSLVKGPYIGISWKSSKVSPFRLKHYPPILEWSRVLTIPDVTFINLQYSNFADDLNEIKDDLGVTIHNFDDLDQYNDVDDVVALCAALDMVVSTKVTPLIFSSGVGTPTKVANWRQSTWNSVLANPVCSSVEMFHRDTWEPWDNVFTSIAEEIIELKNKSTLTPKNI